MTSSPLSPRPAGGRHRPAHAPGPRANFSALCSYIIDLTVGILESDGTIGRFGELRRDCQNSPDLPQVGDGLPFANLLLDLLELVRISRLRLDAEPGEDGRGQVGR